VVLGWGQRFHVGVAAGLFDAGEMTVCKIIEDDAGIDLRVPGDWTPPWEVKHPAEATGSSQPKHVHPGRRLKRKNA